MDSIIIVLIVEQQNGSYFTGRFGMRVISGDLSADILYDAHGTIDQYGYLTITFTDVETNTVTGKYEEGRIKLQDPVYGEMVLLKVL